MTPDASEARVSRMWSRIAEAEARRGAPRWLPLAGVGAALAAALVAFVLWSGPRTLAVGVELAAQATPLEARFSDGSRVELAQTGAVKLLAESPAEMRVGLARGAATFE